MSREAGPEHRRAVAHAIVEARQEVGEPRAVGAAGDGTSGEVPPAVLVVDVVRITVVRDTVLAVLLLPLETARQVGRRSIAVVDVAQQGEALARVERAPHGARERTTCESHRLAR